MFQEEYDLNTDAVDHSAEQEKLKHVRKQKGYMKYSPLSLILLAVCAFVFSFSMLGLFEQGVLDAVGGSVIDVLIDKAFGKINHGSTDPSQGGELIPSGGEVGQWKQIAPSQISPETLPYLQTVDFRSLKSQNPDTVAWMYWPTTTYVKGFPFNFPVVQRGDNEYYLSRSYDGTGNENGWIYADYRCDMTDLRSNRNTIFYGHARSYLIFGGLKYLNTKSKWQEDGYNHFLYINTPTERTVWQVFSWYETTIDFDYIRTDFSGDQEWLAFLETLQSKNAISAFEDYEFTAEDRILTLSTCKGSDKNVRVAVHAVLVKHETLDGYQESTDSTQGNSSGSLNTGTSESTDIPGGEGSLTQTGDSASSTAGQGETTDTGNVSDTDSIPDSGSGSLQPPVQDTSSNIPDGSSSGSVDSSDGEVTDTGTPPDSGDTDADTPSDTDSDVSSGEDPDVPPDTDLPSDSESSDSSEATDSDSSVSSSSESETE